MSVTRRRSRRWSDKEDGTANTEHHVRASSFFPYVSRTHTHTHTPSHPMYDKKYPYLKIKQSSKKVSISANVRTDLKQYTMEMVSRRTSEKGGRGKMKKLCGDSTPLTTCKKMQPIRENGLSVCACSKSPLAAQESMQRFSSFLHVSLLHDKTDKTSFHVSGIHEFSNERMLCVCASLK